MTQANSTSPAVHGRPHDRTIGEGYLFGAPVRDLGWFATVLIAAASGFIAFFAATFSGIVGILIYNRGRQDGLLDLSWSYKRIGLPIGVIVLGVVFAYLGTLWLRRILRKS